MDILKVKQNGVWTTIPAIIGPRGIGITSITKTGTSGLTDTYTITFSDNTTTTFALNNGATPNLTIGTVTEGATAAATITGTAAAPILNLVLPNANVPTRVSQLENDSHYAVDANYVHTDNNYTNDEKIKLSTIAAGAEVNVNADWNAVSGDAQILNKPTIPDIQINGTSIVENGVANIPLGSSSTFGVIKLATIGSGLTFNSGNGLMLNIASYALIKKPQADTVNSLFRPIAPAYQHASVFYGLALAAGDTTQYDSENTIGAYTDEAKAAIQSMLGVPSTSALTGKQDTLTFDTTPTTSSTNPVTSGGIKSYVDTAVSNINTMRIHICTAQEYNSETGVPTIQNPDTQTFYLVPGGDSNNLYIEWAYVNSAWERFGSADVDLSDYATKSEVPDVQINGTSIVSNNVANIPIGSTTTTGDLGVVKSGAGVKISAEGNLYISAAQAEDIKAGESGIYPIAPNRQHNAVFYGLAKAAGVDMASSANAVGTYTAAAQTAIKTMIGVQEGLEVVRLI